LPSHGLKLSRSWHFVLSQFGSAQILFNLEYMELQTVALTAGSHVKTNFLGCPFGTLIYDVQHKGLYHEPGQQVSDKINWAISLHLLGTLTLKAPVLISIFSLVFSIQFLWY